MVLVLGGLTAHFVLLSITPLQAAGSAPFTFDQLKQLAAKSLKSGWVIPVGGKNQIQRDVLEVLDAGALDMMDSDTQDLYVHAFYDEVAIELRRQKLFSRQSSRQTLEPYLSKMEDVVAQKLAVIENQKLSDSARADQLDKLDGQMQHIYEDGLRAVAKSLGLKDFEFISEGAAAPRDVKLHASQGATIEMVRLTTAKLLKEAGKPENDFPWTSYQPDDTASMLGTYYCRIKLGDKQATVTKKVTEKTDRLDFADP
jgi:hypothetical protein